MFTASDNTWSTLTLYGEVIGHGFDIDIRNIMRVLRDTHVILCLRKVDGKDGPRLAGASRAERIDHAIALING